MEKISRTLPAIPLRGLCILPGMVTHFDISREFSKQALEEALRRDKDIFLVMQRDIDAEQPNRQQLWDYGVVAEVRDVAKLTGGLLRVMVEGIHRASLDADVLENGFHVSTVTICDDTTCDLTPLEDEAYGKTLTDLLSRYARQTGKVAKDIVKAIRSMNYLSNIVQETALHLDMSMELRQRFLESGQLEERFTLLTDFLSEEMEIINIRTDLQRKIKERIDKNQKDYVLREHLKQIQEELGENNVENDAEEYLQQLDKLVVSEEIREKIRKEIIRFKSLSGNSPENSVARGYIETLLALPWDKMSEDDEDLAKAERILDEDHYGLKEVKERVLEFLAVKRLADKGISPILCLAGPPGTGKTSVARSIAKALNKEYVRISLGGVRDEAEIRGHRRTYIGAMPGRIIAAMKQAGVKNPLILLDEVDKLSANYNGDPAAALLEVLDSEQNSKFMDHYVDLPTDLSEVMFVATANDLSTVPRPLLDRMEIIEVSSYTDNEKFHIAREHLLPKQIKKHGLTEKQLTVTNKALEEIIAGYTREAGVRGLERNLGKICRKAAKMIWENPEQKVKVKAGNVEEFLGRRKVEVQKKNAHDEVGIVRGLAWTSVGGVTLEVEVNTLPGKGELRLTGQLGDVMKESAAAAISYVRSVAESYGISADYFAKHDVHIHIPEGAVPKDGPSAGVTMATAVLSAASGRPVRSDVAMTGEVTLRGRVLAIGGLKEKLLAAQKAGMRTVVVPYANEKDVEELSEEIIGGMEIIYAKTMKDVLHTALVRK